MHKKYKKIIIINSDLPETNFRLIITHTIIYLLYMF